MAVLTLAAVGTVHLLTAVTFVAVGLRFLHREVGREQAAARNAFVAWWWAFAAYLGLQGAVDLLAAFGWIPLPLVFAQRLLTGPLVAGAAWGLAYHILYLWSGRRWLALPLAFYYGAMAATYSLWIAWHRPIGVAAGSWSTDLVYATPLDGPVWNAVLASIGLPLVLGSLAYLALAFKVHEREARYRIILVGASLLLWVTAGYSAEVAGGHAVRFVAIVVLGLGTAAAVMAAYFPPGRVRRWLEAPRHQPAAH